MPRLRFVYPGVPCTSFTQILPFVIFGVGLDDTFIVMGSYDRTHPGKEAVARIQETIREIGLSIFLTNFTTVVAFGLMATTQIPALFWMSFYALASMVIVFFYTITFFVALIVLDERRIQENRRDCCVFMAGPDDDDETMDTAESMEDGSLVTKQIVTKKKEPKADDETNNQGIAFMAWYADILMKPFSKAIVLLGAVSFFAWCAYSASIFSQAFNVTEMLPSDSYAKAYMTASNDYGQRGWIVPSAYFRNVDQSDEEVQQQMENYVNDLVEIDSISSQPPLFWLRHFKDTFLPYDDRLLELTFNQQVDIFLSHSPFKELYGPHIVRDEETGDIIASRCVLYMDMVDLSSIESQLRALRQQRNVSRHQPVNAGTEDNFFLWEYNMFVWDFYANTASEFKASTISSVVAVTVIGFAFVPHWSAVFIIFPFICILYVDLMGFVQFTGNHLNVVSYFSLVISIGLLVDFLIHMLLRYHECPGKTREAKVKETLKSMGTSVLVAGLSTLLGVLPLAFSTSQLMRTVFVAFMGMVVIGITHGLIVLPVVLSIVGPQHTVELSHSKKALSAASDNGSHRVPMFSKLPVFHPPAKLLDSKAEPNPEPPTALAAQPVILPEPVLVSAASLDAKTEPPLVPEPEPEPPTVLAAQPVILPGPVLVSAASLERVTVIEC
jgi:Niemann-Pick C1 protein